MKSFRVLQKEFFERSAVLVAPDLLGKFLVRRRKGEDGGVREEARMIVEVEAYEGFDDRASHASRGETPRNSVMFGPAGHWYVYLCYGVHEMLNVVTGPAGHPGAVLIRAVEGAVGPGRLTKALGVSREQNKKPATRKAGLWIEDRGAVIPKRAILRTPRIGVSYAGHKWAGKKWRFVLR